ncbi:NAD(+) kinase, partial [[Ruminococcus] torques]|nr:NAD(+) kinase [[Ruminococcus] torques]
QTLSPVTRVCIKRSSHTAKLIKLSKESFMKTIRKKMKGN